MEHALEFVGRHGAVVIFAVVFLDQLGLPLPSVPMLLAFGALAGTGRIAPVSGLLLATLASLCADSIWFLMGRWKGSRVLGFLCRIALEPDSCVSKTHDLFARRGVKSLLVAKFIPGFDTVAPPLAGLLRIPTLQFVLWSAAGALLWAGTFGGLGYLFSGHLEELAGALDRFGNTLLWVLLALVAAYVGWKYLERRRVLQSIRLARITPQELHELILDGQGPVILDARGRSEIDALPFVIEGALSLALDEVEARHLELPRGRDVVVYCT